MSTLSSALSTAANQVATTAANTISSVTGTGTSTGTSSSGSTGSSSTTAGAPSLAGNFNTFLQILTTQLQNQDPLDPMDTNSFTQELVEFASVEQQVNMNTNLQTLITMQQTTEATSALQLVGSTVTVAGSGATLSNATGSPATWSLNASGPATANVTITSSANTTVYTGTVALNSGTNTFTWSGQGNNGQTWPDGTYTLTVNATGANGQPVTVSTQVQGTVSGVNINANPPTLTINGQSVPINQVQSISNGELSSLSNTLTSSINSLNSGINGLNSSLNSGLGTVNTSLNSILKAL